MSYSTIGVGLERLSVPLIHLVGLDATRNAVHKYIQDTFRNSQNKPANFSFVPVDYSYPASKAKKEDLDMFIPDGIIKSGWLEKHLERVPSLVCLFVDLEWTDPNWNARLGEIVSKLQVLRQLLVNRRTQLTIVLMQAQQSSENHSERIEQLRTQTEIARNGIFVLPVMPDHLSGYIQRLQNLLLERSYAYYENQITEVKMRTEMYASKLHPILFCRYLFKVAFYSEMRQNTEDALTFYKHCYSRLTSEQVPITQQNLTQVRAFASLVNFKLIKMYLTVPPHFQRDYASKQLNKHLEYFGVQRGPPELLFEYHGWVANQLRIFADLLSEHNNGLRVNGQAGFFYLKAARHERERAAFIRQIKAQVLKQVYPQNDPLSKPVIYLGERVWRTGGLSGEWNQNDEMLGMFALQYKECQIDHCLEITRTLNKANMEFKPGFNKESFA